MLIMASRPNQSNEFSMLHGDDGSVFLTLEELNVQLEYFNLFDAWITHSLKV